MRDKETVSKDSINCADPPPFERFRPMCAPHSQSINCCGFLCSAKINKTLAAKVSKKKFMNLDKNMGAQCRIKVFIWVQDNIIHVKSKQGTSAITQQHQRSFS